MLCIQFDIWHLLKVWFNVYFWFYLVHFFSAQIGFISFVVVIYVSLLVGLRLWMIFVSLTSAWRNYFGCFGICLSYCNMLVLFLLLTGNEASPNWSKELSCNFYVLICCGYQPWINSLFPSSILSKRLCEYNDFFFSQVGLGSFLLRYLPGLLRTILTEIGISEDMYNPVCKLY